MFSTPNCMKKLLLFSLVGLLALPVSASVAAVAIDGYALEKSISAQRPKKKFKKRKRNKARRPSKGFLGLGKKNGCGCPKY
jgi:hypothetical protein